MNKRNINTVRSQTNCVPIPPAEGGPPVASAYGTSGVTDAHARYSISYSCKALTIDERSSMPDEDSYRPFSQPTYQIICFPTDLN
jgi:hypothetical protein